MFNFVFKKEVWLPVAALVMIGGFIYVFNLHNGLFWDDEDWIINNNFVHSLSWDNIKFWFANNTLAGVGLKSNYYRPFLFFTFAINFAVAGIKPLFYHLTSNLMHLFNGVLVFWLIRRSFQRNSLAFLVALFFLVHPLQTEAVTYISGRGDVLVAMFMLLSLVLFQRAERRGKNWKSWEKILSLVFLPLGILSRETGIIFPLLALTFYIGGALSKERFWPSVKTGLLKTWPYFAVVLIYGILRLTVLNFLNTLNFYLEPNLYSENLYVRMLTFLPILWQYLKLLIVPVGLHMERGADIYISFLQWPVWIIGLFIVGIGYLPFRFYRKEQQPTTNFRVWFLGIFWFFIALAPVSGITPINALMYEHWLYLPMVGFWLIVSFFLVKLFDYLKFKKQLMAYSLLLMVLGAYLSFFGYQSIQRNILWGKSTEFYKDILKYEPQSVRISNNLGNLYFNQGNKEQAEIYYRQAVETGDAFPQPYFNLGSMLQNRGDIFGAIKLYEKAIAINQNFFYPYQSLAVIYAQQGNWTKAIENIEKLKVLLPNNPRVFYNSALVYLSLNNTKQALLDLQTGVKYAELDPETGTLMGELIKKISSP